MKDRSNITLMNNARIRRTLKRMIFQIAEQARGREVLLIGLNERGSTIAREMGNHLEDTLDHPPVIDSFQVNGNDMEETAAAIRKEHDFDGKLIVLVDDVIFSGKTMFTALQKLLTDLDCTVYSAVLVDRGHRTIPVQAGFVGMEISTKPNEHVEVLLKNGMAHQVLLYKTDQTSQI